MNELALLLGLGLLLSQGGGSPLPQGSSGSGSTGGSEPPKDPLLDAARGALGVLGTAGTAGGGGAAATAGGSAAGGSTAAGSSTTATATTAGTGAAGGVVGGATNGAVAITNAAGQIIGAVEAGAGMGAAAVIVGVVVAFIIAKRVADAQEIDKDWQGYLLGLNANGAGLHQFEAMCVRAVIQGRTFTERQQRDFRLDRYAPGQKIVFTGYRSAYNFIPMPGERETFKRLRAMAFEYLRLRAGHGYRMIRNWSVIPNPPANWGLSNAALYDEYNAVMPGVGGLASIPHAVGGATIAPRVSDSENPSDPLQLISNEYLTNISGITLTAEENQACALVAIIDALRVLKFDPRPAIEADRRWYAGEVLRALSHPTDHTPPEGITQAGEALELDPRVFGARRYIWPARLKLREGSWLTA